MTVIAQDDHLTARARAACAWAELQGKGSPQTYTFDKFRARKCTFCTVFPCQICLDLHEIYSSVLLTKREVKMPDCWLSYLFIYLQNVKKKKQKKKPGLNSAILTEQAWSREFIFS